MKIGFLFFLAFILVLALAGFKGKTVNTAVANASLSLIFDNVAGTADLELDKGNYTNTKGESFTVSQLQYFVSNFKFRKADGSEYIVPQDESYFLVQENETATQTIRLKVPEGDYKSISFVLGVDSLRNTMDISQRTGVLDPASSMDNGMYWGWNSGYIFFKMEGNSAAAPADPIGRQKYRYHIGGFGGYSSRTINNLKTISLELGTSGLAKPRQGKGSMIWLEADILKAFNGTTAVSIREHPSVMFSPFSVNIANNYSKMFAHRRTEN